MKTPRHILVAEMPYLLLSFLIEKKALEPFIVAVIKHGSIHDATAATNRAKSYYDEYWMDKIVICLFIWHWTPQGYEFWSNINKEWELVWKQRML